MVLASTPVQAFNEDPGMVFGLAKQSVGPAAFWAGCAATFVGGLLHLPMLMMAHSMGNRLVGMPMDTSMYIGMALIALGVALSIFGALSGRRWNSGERQEARFETAANGPLSIHQIMVLGVLTIGLVIDMMKPATLGFVLPGLRSEYGLDKATAAYLPFAALIGTTLGSVVWGWIADAYGRRTSILLAAILFVATSICGAMPSFEWNLVMCFLMGCSAGGMLPVVYTLLAEILPAKHRGFALVLVGGIGSVGGYLAAGFAAHTLEPIYGWRSLWLLGFPTGLLLLACAPLIPENPRMLLSLGRKKELQDLQRKFGIVRLPDIESLPPASPESKQASLLTASLVIAALVWSMVNFGLLLWLPTDLAARGYSSAAASGLLAKSALIALPTIAVGAVLYSRWSSKRTLIAAMLLTAAGLVGAGLPGGSLAREPVLLGVIVLLIVGANLIIVVLLPYAAESYPFNVRGRVTGVVAGSSKLGGVAIQALALGGLIPSLAGTSFGLIVPVLLSTVLIWKFGTETRGRILPEHH